MKFKKSISFALTLCMVLSLFATFVIPASAAEKAVTATVTDGSVKILTEKLAILCDGNDAASATAFSDAGLVAFENTGFTHTDGVDAAVSATIEFVLDLGETTGISGAYMTFFRDDASMVALPSGVVFEGSVDGKYWYNLNAGGTVAPSADDKTVATAKADFSTRAVYDVRYVKATATFKNGWVFAGELGVLAAGNSGVGAIAPDYAFAYTADSTPSSNCIGIFGAGTYDLAASEEGKYLKSGQLLIAKEVADGIYVTSMNKVNPWPDGHSGEVTIAEDEILVSIVTAGALANNETDYYTTAKWITRGLPNEGTVIVVDKEASTVAFYPANYEVPEKLPEDATGLDIYGYTHTTKNYVMYVDADMTLGELTAKYYGSSKDLNYFKVIVVNEDGTVAATYLDIDRNTNPASVKTDIAVTKGQVVLALSANEVNAGRFEIAETVKVGDIVTLYNVDFDAESNTELSGAGFTVEAVAPKYNEVVVDVNANAILTDGASDFSGGWGAVGTSKVVLISNDKCKEMAMKAVVNYALGETKSINALTLDFYHCAAVMIGYPEGKILVEVSVDGETYTKVGEFDVAAATLSTTADGTVSTVCEFDAVDAAYVRATFVAGSSTGVLGDSPADGKVFWEFASLAEVAVSEVVPATSQVVTDWNVSNWGSSANGANGAYLFTDQEAYLACTHTWWSHASFKPTTIAGVYEVVAVRGATGEAASFEIAEGGFVLTAHDTAAAGTAGAYVHALIKTLAVGDRVIFNGLDVANLTTTADATAVIVPTAEDMDLIVSHNYNYSWHCFETQIITMAVGEANLKKAGDAPNMSAEDTDILYIVELVDGAYKVTGVVGGKALLDVEIPENGFLYYVTKNCTGYDKICHGELVGKYLVLGDIDLATKFAIDTSKDSGYTMKAVSSFKTGDLNLNGEIDATDYAILRKLVLGTLTAEDIGDLAYATADVNGDKVVNARDYYLVKRAFLGTYVIPGWEEDDAE